MYHIRYTIWTIQKNSQIYSSETKIKCNGCLLFLKWIFIWSHKSRNSNGKEYGLIKLEYEFIRQSCNSFQAYQYFRLNRSIFTLLFVPREV